MSNTDNDRDNYWVASSDQVDAKPAPNVIRINKAPAPHEVDGMSFADFHLGKPYHGGFPDAPAAFATPVHMGFATALTPIPTAAQGVQAIQFSRTSSTVSELRARGHAVVIFAPSELRGVDPNKLEARLVDLGFEVITVMQPQPEVVPVVTERKVFEITKPGADPVAWVVAASVREVMDAMTLLQGQELKVVETDLPVANSGNDAYLPEDADTLKALLYSLFGRP